MERGLQTSDSLSVHETQNMASYGGGSRPLKRISSRCGLTSDNLKPRRDPHEVTQSLRRSPGAFVRMGLMNVGKVPEVTDRA